MAMFLVIILAVALVAVFAVMALRRGGSDSAATGKKRKSGLSGAAQKEPPGDEAMIIGSPTVGSAGGDSGTSVMYKDLRQYLLDGIGRIFDEDAPVPDERSMPRTREQIDPQTLRTALDHLAGMDQFRAQQVRLQKLLNDPAVQMTDLSKSITSDPLMTAKVLKIANSSYFGVAQKIDSISHALMILGMQNIKSIMYREGMRDLFETGAPHNRAAAAALWKHSNLVAVCTQHFYDLFEGLNRGTLFTLGMVHDIGKLILMSASRSLPGTAALGDEYPTDLLIGEEDRRFGFNHAVIGGCALEQWNFSELMIGAVTNHHAPSFVEADRVHLAHELLTYVLVLSLSDAVARLFTGWNEGAAHIYPLRGSYFGLIDRKRLVNKVSDGIFLNQMRAVEMISTAEYQR